MERGLVGFDFDLCMRNFSIVSQEMIEKYYSACERPKQWLEDFFIDDVVFDGIFAKKNYHTLVHSDKFVLVGQANQCLNSCVAIHMHPKTDTNYNNEDIIQQFRKFAKYA